MLKDSKIGLGILDLLKDLSVTNPTVRRLLKVSIVSFGLNNYN